MRLPTPEERTFSEQAVSRYQSDLRGDTPAQGYLTSRGISPDVAATFRLGVVRSPLLGHDRFRGKLCIPYLTPAGVVTYSFRCIHPGPCEGHGKYSYETGAERTLYNVLDLKKDGPVIRVVEGELDALTLSSLGYACVGVPGVQSWKKFFGRCLSDYREIHVVCDGDDAGYELGNFLAREVRARVVRLPRGYDVNSLYLQGGIHAIRQALQA